MDCRTCQPTLIDLLYGELATDAADAARAHLRECSSCRAAYDKLAAGLRAARTLEIMEPPAQVEHKLLELAQARAVAIAEQRAAAAPPVPSPWRVAIDFVRRFAMASQVKMVAASALVVTVVLLALPRLLLPAKMTPVSMTEEPASSASEVQTVPAAPAPKEEAAPADAVQPAEAPGRKVDAHAARARSADETGSQFAMQQERLQQPAANADLDRVAKLRDEKKSLGPQAAASKVRLARPVQSSASADKGGSRAQGKTSSGDEPILNAYRSDAPAAPPPAASPSPFPSNEGALARASVSKKAKTSDESSLDGLEVAASSSGGLSARAGGTGAGSATAGRSQAPAKAASPAAVTASPAREAESADAQTSSQERARQTLVSRLQTARAIAQHDGCAAALSSYQQVVAAGSSSLEAGEALLDMAHCRIALGQPAIARALLERASRIPAVATRARAMLESSAAPNIETAPTAAEPPK